MRTPPTAGGVQKHTATCYSYITLMTRPPLGSPLSSATGCMVSEPGIATPHGGTVRRNWTHKLLPYVVLSAGISSVQCHGLHGEPGIATSHGGTVRRNRTHNCASWDVTCMCQCHWMLSVCDEAAAHSLILIKCVTCWDLHMSTCQCHCLYGASDLTLQTRSALSRALFWDLHVPVPK